MENESNCYFSVKEPKPDWRAVRRAQDIHRKLWNELRNEWRDNYRFGSTKETRMQAGENLDYSRPRIALNEFLQPFYELGDRFYAKFIAHDRDLM
jgi:hypothetical protein